MSEEKTNMLSGRFNVKRAVMFFVAVLVTLILWNLSPDVYGIDGLTIIQQRVIAIFAFATILWITEAIPSWATSVTLIATLLFTTSDNAFHFFRSGIDKTDLLDHEALMATFADPIIILFLGGFILAIAATKSGLDVLLARTLLKPFGRKSENVLLGFILITGAFSMFISHTSTAAMMLTFLTPVFKALPPEGKGRVALTLAIPIAANIGGMGTPIGTPPNAIALKYLNDPAGLNLNLGFGQWMSFMLPLTILPIAVFAFTGIVTAKDLQDINWSVIWMVAGGFALGLALNQSKLAERAIESIPFGSWSPLVILFISGAICYILSNFISNTATAALLVPILTVVCKGMGDSLSGIGGTPTVLIGIAIAASTAMCLPISTPPNAIAHSTGLVHQNEMIKIGLNV